MSQFQIPYPQFTSYSVGLIERRVMAVLSMCDHDNLYIFILIPYSPMVAQCFLARHCFLESAEDLQFGSGFWCRVGGPDSKMSCEVLVPDEFRHDPRCPVMLNMVSPRCPMEIYRVYVLIVY